MAKEDMMIVTVPNSVIFPSGVHTEGFIPQHERDLLSTLSAHYSFTRRGDAETNFTMKQPISYAAIRNTKGEIFAYQRGSKRAEFHETRLAGKWSCGIGGHIEAEDQASSNIFETSLIRELEEEITLNGPITKVSPIGYINSERDEVSRVHIGILYVVDTTATSAQGSEEVVNEGFYAPSALREMLGDPSKKWEEWTKIALSALIGN